MKKTQFKTYDNSTAPIKDNITKTSFKMTFSKSNFMFIGKWIIAFVLIIVFGSQALNGFISSKFTQNTTSETIVHEYKKEIGEELLGGDFNFLLSNNDFNQLKNMKIYLKKNLTDDYLNAFENPIVWGSSGNLLTFSSVYPIVNIFDDNNNLITTSSNFGLVYTQAFSQTYIPNSTYYAYRYRNQNYLGSNDTSFSYFICDSDANISSLFPLNTIVTFLNYFFYNDSVIKIPIYETTTYTYEVKDNNYNWDTKLKQLSAFKPLFKFNQSFVNDDYVKYSNLISYEFVDTESSRENLINQYKLDERLNVLFDNNYITISGKTESGIFKDKTKFYSYIKINFPLDYDIPGVSSAYNWVIDNYVTDFNIDSYLTESKYKIELKDLLEIFKFPFQIVNNLVYNFGVLIGFITWW